MVIHHNLPHWNYYRLLEEDLEKCFRFVAPFEEHWNVYSDEFSRIILMAATEIENALKAFVFWTFKEKPPSSIHQYFNCIHEKYPSFCSMEMVMPRYSIGFKPWDGWSASSAPDWWTYGYNKIKHDRMNHPNAPTLIRAIKAVGSLQVLLLHYYRLRYRQCGFSFDVKPHLICPWDKYNESDEFLDATISWTWRLPNEDQT